MMSNKELFNKEKMVEMEIEEQCDKVDAEDSSILFTLQPLNDHTYFSSSQPEKKNPDPSKSYTSKNKILGIITGLPRNKLKGSPIYTVNHNPNIMVLHRCTICGYSTNKQDTYKEHQEQHSTLPLIVKNRTMPCGVYALNEDAPIQDGCQKCPFCSYTAKTTASLRVHAHTHTNRTSYNCSECSFRGRNMQELTTHLKTAKMFVCGSCQFMSHVKDKFLKHQESAIHKKIKAAYKRRTRKQ